VGKRVATKPKTASAKAAVSQTPTTAPAANVKTPTEVASAQQPAKAVTAEDIWLRAYLLWEAAGRPEGDGIRFWLEAEQELRQGNSLN
jgi:hypothetical protein